MTNRYWIAFENAIRILVNEKDPAEVAYKKTARRYLSVPAWEEHSHVVLDGLRERNNPFGISWESQGSLWLGLVSPVGPVSVIPDVPVRGQVATI